MLNTLEVVDLSHPLFGSISLQTDSSKNIVIIGPSGSGKTLLLKCIADLVPASGDILFNGTSRYHFAPANWRKTVGFLSAETHWWGNTASDSIYNIRHEDLDTLNLKPEILHKPITECSTGERQRLALLRLLQNSPKVLLLDEPTANLDLINTKACEALISHYAKQHQAVLIWVTHDEEQIARLHPLVFAMENGVLTQ